MPAALTVLYDEDCGFCRWAVAQLLAADRERRLAPEAIQSAAGQRLLAHLPPEERLAAAHAVDPGGRVFTGGDAVAPILRALRGRRVEPAPLAAALPARLGYRLVAGSRGLLGRVLTTGMRARATEAIARRRDQSPEG
jgi:predicted DCC family thiol-disulfide oxidoreductase YuxK